MLTIELKESEYYDSATESFVTFPAVVLQLEHSLVSLSKWESEYEKPFLNTKEKTDEEILGYVRMMILTPVFPENVLDRMSPEDFQRINRYIDAKMTATWFSDKPNQPSREIITAEILYYWMTVFNIPFSCENWHLNRLLTLIRVCNAKNKPHKKMSKTEVAQRNRELNAQRRAKYGTRG